MRHRHSGLVGVENAVTCIGLGLSLLAVGLALHRRRRRRRTLDGDVRGHTASTRAMRTRPSRASMPSTETAAASDMPSRRPISPGLIPPGSLRHARTASSSSLHHSSTLVAAAAPIAAAVPAALAAGAPGLGDLDLQRPAVHFLTVELLDRRVRVFGRRHLDEAEPARAARALLHHDRRGLDLARLGEHFSKTIARRRKRQASDEQFVRHGTPPTETPAVKKHALEQRKQAPETGSDEEGGPQRTDDRTRPAEYDTRAFERLSKSGREESPLSSVAAKPAANSGERGGGAAADPL